MTWGHDVGQLPPLCDAGGETEVVALAEALCSSGEGQESPQNLARVLMSPELSLGTGVSDDGDTGHFEGALGQCRTHPDTEFSAKGDFIYPGGTSRGLTLHGAKTAAGGSARSGF